MTNCTGVPAPEVVAYATAILSVVFSVITLPGNILICLAFVIDPYKKLRTPFNFLILNLALADLSVGLIEEPLSAVQHFREALRLVFTTLQKVHHYIYFITCTASILSLGALTAERYTAASSTTSYRTRQTVSIGRNIFKSVAIWVISALISGFYFLLGPLRQAIIFAVTAVAATFAILIFTYLSIYSVLRTQTLAHKDKECSEAGEIKKAKLALRVLEREKKLTKVFALILLCYIGCFIPACVLIFMMNYCVTCSCEVIHWLRDVQFWFVLLNSVINPFLYALRIPHFRRAASYILRCQANTHIISKLSITSNSLTAVQSTTFVTRTDQKAPVQGNPTNAFEAF